MTGRGSSAYTPACFDHERIPLLLRPLWTLLLLLAAFQCMALDTGVAPGALLGKQLMVWEEDAPLESPYDILASTKTWHPSHSHIPNPGVGNNVTWYRLSISTPEPDSDHYAVISYPLIERLEMFVFQGRNLLSQSLVGNSVLREPGIRPNLCFELPLVLPTSGEYDIYFRVENRGLLNFPLKILDQETLKTSNQNRHLSFGLYAGFLVAVFLYNLAVFVVIRERYMLWFCGFVGTYLLFFLAHSGLGFSYLWTSAYGFEQRASIVLGALPMFMAVLFAATFLPTPKRHRKPAIHVKHLAIVAAVTGLACTLIPDYQIALNTMRVTTLLIPVCLIAMATLSGVLRSPSVAVYSVGIYSLAIAIIIHSLSRQGFIATTEISQYATHLGAGSMIAIHSLAIVLKLYEQRLEQVRTRKAMIKARKESRKSEEKLRQSERSLQRTEEEAKAKSAFLAMMSHEIRTPLNGVLGMVELLEHTRLDSQQKRYVGTISSSGETLLSLLNDILDLSKIESGKMTMEKREVALAPLINDSILLYTRQAAEKNLTLIAEMLPPYHQFIHTDEIRLRQILNNLLNNAVKFTEHGRVLLRVEWKEDALVIQVEDSGIGIHLSQQDRLFQSFSQADDSTQRQYGGTGLGLTICQKLAELLGGSIDVSSKPGAGSRFTVTLNHPEPSGLITYPDLSNRSFYAELSDPYEQDLVVRTLTGMGMTAAHGHFENPDCIITDVPPPQSDPAPGFLYVVNSQVPRLGSERQLERPLRSHVLIHQLCNLLDLHNASPIKGDNDFRNGVIWVAEDNLVNQKVIAGMLKHMGMEFQIFDNGAQILSAYEANPDQPDLILMDCEMPVMDGYEASRQIRKLQKTNALPPIPVIALTAHLGIEFEKYSRDAGMDELLNKPIRKQNLRRLFEMWLPNDKESRKAPTTTG